MEELQTQLEACEQELLREDGNKQQILDKITNIRNLLFEIISYKRVTDEDEVEDEEYNYENDPNCD